MTTKFTTVQEVLLHQGDEKIKGLLGIAEESDSATLEVSCNNGVSLAVLCQVQVLVEDLRKKFPDASNPMEVWKQKLSEAKFELLDDQTVRIRLSKRLASGLVRVLWEGTLTTVENRTAFDFGQSLYQSQMDLRTRVEELQSQTTRLQQARDEWKDTANQLETVWAKEKNELLSNFLTLYHKQQQMTKEAEERVQELTRSLEQRSVTRTATPAEPKPKPAPKKKAPPKPKAPAKKKAVPRTKRAREVVEEDPDSAHEGEEEQEAEKPVVSRPTRRTTRKAKPIAKAVESDKSDEEAEFPSNPKEEEPPKSDDPPPPKKEPEKAMDSDDDDSSVDLTSYFKSSKSSEPATDESKQSEKKSQPTKKASVKEENASDGSGAEDMEEEEEGKKPKSRATKAKSTAARKRATKPPAAKKARKTKEVEEESGEDSDMDIDLLAQIAALKDADD